MGKIRGEIGGEITGTIGDVTIALASLYPEPRSPKSLDRLVDDREVTLKCYDLVLTQPLTCVTNLSSLLVIRHGK